VSKLSDALKKKWISIFNTAEDKYGEEKAFIIANTWLKRNITKKEVVAKTEKTLTLIKFEVDDSKELIKRADNGDEYIDFVLTDNLPDSKGVQYPEHILKKWVKEINSGELSLNGDIDHEEYDRLLAEGLSPEEVIARLKNKTGIAKTLKAIYEKGKLWVRAIIDKRYKKQIKEKAQGVSLEAMLLRDEDDNIVDAELGGFTFGVDCKPINGRAVIA
jgi:hypothetical protein